MLTLQRIFYQSFNDIVLNAMVLAYNRVVCVLMIEMNSCLVVIQDQQ